MHPYASLTSVYILKHKDAYVRTPVYMWMQVDAHGAYGAYECIWMYMDVYGYITDA